MGDKSEIGWTEATWNMLVAFVLDNESGSYTFADAPGMKWRRGWFCIHDSEGCRNCYAEKMNLWRGNGLTYKAQNLPLVRFEFVGLDQPVRWTRPRMIFPCSMTDLFADFYTDEQIDRAFAMMALGWWHTYQVLTKRAKRMREYMTHPEREAVWMTAVAKLLEEFGLQKHKAVARAPIFHQREPLLPLPNVWLGVSVEDQKNADKRVPELSQTPAAVRWVSAEPLLGPVDFLSVDSATAQSLGNTLLWPVDRIDWVVAGGESGKNARPMHPQWVRDLRDSCESGDVPFFFKQWGQFRPGYIGGDIARCVVCGCTENRACPGGCAWASGDRSIYDVCTNCAPANLELFQGEVMVRFADKELAGNTLDDRRHEEWPKVTREVRI